jgi:hypothetical protein
VILETILNCSQWSVPRQNKCDPLTAKHLTLSNKILTSDESEASWEFTWMIQTAMTHYLVNCFITSKSRVAFLLLATPLKLNLNFFSCFPFTNQKLLDLLCLDPAFGSKKTVVIGTLIELKSTILSTLLLLQCIIYCNLCICASEMDCPVGCHSSP